MQLVIIVLCALLSWPGYAQETASHLFNVQQTTAPLSSSVEAESSNNTLLSNTLTEGMNAQLPSEMDFLHADQAFALSVEARNTDVLKFTWIIAKGYYLYRDKIEFSLQGEGMLVTPTMPPSVTKQDPLYGHVEVYNQAVLTIDVPLTITENTRAIHVKYQGCAEAGFCYAPETKLVPLPLQVGVVYAPESEEATSQPPVVTPSLASQIVPSLSSQPVPEQDRLSLLIAQRNIVYAMLVFFGLGVLLALTPCVLPMIPILSSLIVGQGKQVTPLKTFVLSSVYVLAMALTYAGMGLIFGLLGKNLQATLQSTEVLVTFSLIFIALSFSLFGFYELQLPSVLQTQLTRLSNRQQGGNLIGVAIMGILSALIVGPCVSAPLAGALMYITQTGSLFVGGAVLFSLGLGMGAPLILVGTSAGHLLPKTGAWMNKVKAIFGVLLLATAIWIMTPILPGQVNIVLWAILLIVSSVYMGALETLVPGISGWYKLWKGVGVIFLVYGILLVIGAASGSTNVLEPLEKLSLLNTDNQACAATNEVNFKKVKGLDEVTKEVTAASRQGKPVMLDFYADWCVSCKEMEYFTFNNSKVQEVLRHFVLLQTDVTLYDEQDKALQKHFDIVGPPAILFFGPDGQEQKNYRIVGFMSADEFHQHLNKLLAKP